MIVVSIMDDKEKIEEDDLCQECSTKIKDHTGEDLRLCISVLEGMMEHMKNPTKWDDADVAIRPYDDGFRTPNQCPICSGEIKDHTEEDTHDCIAIIEKVTPPMKQLLKKIEERYGLR